jgi:hypothetical protein
MINSTIERIRGVRSWILSPSSLLDRFLDWIEELGMSIVAMPAQVDRAIHREKPIEPRLDHLVG